MVLVIQSFPCVDLMLKLKILNHLFCVSIFFLFKDLSSSIEQVNILCYGYPPNKSDALNQDIIKFVINFLKNLVPSIRGTKATMILCLSKTHQKKHVESIFRPSKLCRKSISKWRRSFSHESYIKKHVKITWKFVNIDGST